MVRQRRPDRAREAAQVLRSILAALPFPAAVAAYLRGHADSLEARRDPKDVHKS